MIQTADTDYAADYDNAYEKPIKSRCLDQKSLKIVYLTLKISNDLFQSSANNKFFIW